MSQIAATIADSALAEADTYATAMQSLATTAPSPWATLESDQAAARRDRVAAEAAASVARVGTTSDAWRDYQIARAIELKVYQIAFVDSERVLASQTATAARDRAVSESDAEIALAATGHYSGEVPNSLGTLTTSFSTVAASSEHYTQLTSGSVIGPEGGPVFAPPAPQPRVGGDQLDISKFNPTDPSQDRDNLAYVEMTRRWMETRGDRAEQYAEYREQQQAQQTSGDSSWLYEAKQRGKELALADVKRQNRLSMWGAVFNLRAIVPAGSQADNYLGAAEEAVAAAQLQGQLNIVNGLTNVLVEGFNTSLYVMMGIPTTALTNLANTAAGEAVLPTEFPQIPVIDYSQDAFVFEDPYWHGWSVWCGGTGITMLLPGGIAKQAGPALKGSSIGRMFTGVSKAQSGTVEAVVSQAKSLVPKSLGKVRLPRATTRPTQVAEGLKGAANRVTLRSGGDRLLESMGPARVKHADEFASIIDDLRVNDVNIRFEANGLRYGPSARSGKVGNIVLDPDASISAIRHEYGHFLDDLAEGLPGARHYYENPWRWVATERRQYLREIRTAKQLGDSKARAQLIQDYVNERRYILDTYLPKR